MIPRLAAAAVVLVLIAACSSDPKVVGSTDSAATPSTTGAPPVTTVPVPDTTVADTAASTTATPTTVATTGPALDSRLSPEPLGFDGECSEAGCISVGVTLAGEVVTFDSANSTLTFTQSGTSLAVDSPFGDTAYLAMMGPDDVAYIAGSPPTATDPLLELIAVATSGAAAGQEIARVGDLDGTGDSTLIATATGVMQVGCCGFGERLPAAGTAVAMAWVSPTGEPSGAVVPAVHLEYPGDDTTIVVRTAADGAEQRWPVPAMLAGRDMPPVAAADDGGALVWLFDPIGAPETPAVLYDLRPDGTVDMFAMGEFDYLGALHSSRVVICWNGDTYARIALP